MIRKAKAVWRGTGRAGTGHLSTDSGVLAGDPVFFKTDLKMRRVPIPKS
jgi:lipoyl-dependent peroxiredoxin